MMKSGYEAAWSDLISPTQGERGRLNVGDRPVPECQKPQEAHLNTQRNPIKGLAETTHLEKREQEGRPGRRAADSLCLGQQYHHKHH